MSVGLKANVDGSGAIQVGGSDAITMSTGLNATFVQNANLPNTFGFKNRIINGAMVIDQRNAGASVTPTTGTYIVDRWQAQLSLPSKYSIQQNAGSVTPPAGYSNYLGVTSLSAYSVLTSDYFGVSQSIEGLNMADLAWGTASAATVTISFWVRSSLTGTFGAVLNNSASNRSYPFTYTISAANTWEQKSVTIAGDTSGTWLTTNGVGIRLWFNLGAGATYSGTAGAWAGAGYLAPTGATSVVGTSGATFYVTGVQLEKGSTATSFDYRPYGTEFALCQRYFEKVGFGDSNSRYPCVFGYAVSAAATLQASVNFVVAKRALPTLSKGTEGLTLNGTTTADGASYQGFRYFITATATGQAGAQFYADGITATAEL